MFKYGLTLVSILYRLYRALFIYIIITTYITGPIWTITWPVASSLEKGTPTIGRLVLSRLPFPAV